MKILACLLLLMVGCGVDPSGEAHDQTPAPLPAPLPSPSPISFAVATVVTDEQCASSGCHAGAGFLQNAAAFKASSARQRINAGNMPKKSGPNYALYNSAKKKTLLDFLSN